MSLNQGILSERLVIINSFEVAKTLMNGRSENYSARPFIVQREYVLIHLVLKLFLLAPSNATDWMLTHLSGNPHRVRRTIAQRYYSGPAAKAHQHVQQEETHDLLRVISASPNDLRNHLNRFVPPHISAFTLLQTHV